MNVRLCRVDRDNLDATLKLRVTDEQNRFVAPNIVSMAQAAVMPEFTPFIAYDGETPVGFALYAVDRDDNECWIHRLMVDQALQGRGYGREILRQTIEQIRREHPARKKLYISFVTTNDVARRLYESFGFQPDGRVLENETVYVKKLSE